MGISEKHFILFWHTKIPSWKETKRTFDARNGNMNLKCFNEVMGWLFWVNKPLLQVIHDKNVTCKMSNDAPLSCMNVSHRYQLKMYQNRQHFGTLNSPLFPPNQSEQLKYILDFSLISMNNHYLIWNVFDYHVNEQN